MAERLKMPDIIEGGLVIALAIWIVISFWFFERAIISGTEAVWTVLSVTFEAMMCAILFVIAILLASIRRKIH